MNKALVAILTIFQSLSVFATEMKVRFCDKPFTLEVANTEALREKGLMDRKGVQHGHGMLFLFRDETTKSFWMKNVLMDLDIVFFDHNGKVVSVQRMAMESPLLQDQARKTYDSGGATQFAIEFAAGTFSSQPEKTKKCVLKPVPKIDASVE